MWYERQTSNVADVTVVISLWWRKISPAGWELVVIIIYNCVTVKYLKDTDDETSIQVICDTPTIVTLSRQVDQGF